MSIYKQLYTAGFENDHAKIKELYQQDMKFHSDMVAMGASSGNNQQLTEWAVKQGACLLFTIQQSGRITYNVKANSNSRLK